MTTILIVDDDRKITDMLRRTLIYEGYRVVTAADGEEALIKAQSERPGSRHPRLADAQAQRPGNGQSCCASPIPCRS